MKVNSLILFLLRMVCGRCEYTEVLATENEQRQQVDSINHLSGFAEEDRP